jgi:hypothetical protein
MHIPGVIWWFLVQTRDKWGFQMTGRHEVYANLLASYASNDFKPQRIQ